MFHSVLFLCPAAMKSCSQSDGQRNFSLWINLDPSSAWLRKRGPRTGGWGPGASGKSATHTEKPAGIVLSLHLLWGCSVLQPSPLHPAWAQKLLMEYVNCVHAPHNRLRHLDCPQRTTFASHTRRGSGTRIFLHAPPFLSEHSLMQEELDSSQAVRIKPGDSFPG